ncbi:Hypothetical protein GbCGDNIH9_8001 [Granulibacter bethesdensis]|uniref:Uncharacterized protein n=1 Tax=Granulibacter bethesdensis TaxID=364410 RepID=A0AAC9P7J4_9PROT|nr:Hypothetical protein GbCGDNIH9_8001 [Granulibacter bethesdensis]APH60816.1 Hypothetical protein GbCGDNIH8_8384 [Granulibacter bethesdensis]
MTFSMMTTARLQDADGSPESGVKTVEGASFIHHVRWVEARGDMVAGHV